jgi:hypothetical protein
VVNVSPPAVLHPTRHRWRTHTSTGTHHAAPWRSGSLHGSHAGSKFSSRSRTHGSGSRVAGRGGHSGRFHHSDIRLKEAIVPIARLDNGIGLYRFRYRGSPTIYVGVMAQEVQTIMPEAVVRGNDSYLWVDYGRVGVPFMTWTQWVERHAAQAH